MKNMLQRLLSGRYGLDSYGRFLSFVSLAFVIIGLITSRLTNFFNIFSLFGMLLLIYCYYRIFSRKIQRRAQENYVYYGARAEVIRFLNNTKKRIFTMRTHKIFKCPNCKQQLRVPRGRGKISIKCSRCKDEFIRKS